jgi:hypothetical protein
MSVERVCELAGEPHMSPVARHSIHEAIEDNATAEKLTYAFLCGVSLAVIVCGAVVYFK